MASGDRCAFVTDASGKPILVRHSECDEYPDGTLTSLETGEVVRL